MGSFKLVKRPLPAGKQFDIFRDELVKRLQPVAGRRADAYKKAVSSWQSNHKPDFRGQVVVPKQARINIRVIIRNGSEVFNKYGTTIKQLWDIWNKGSRAHIIRPRFASVLRFVIDNTVIFTNLVNHPGTRGTKEKEKIDRRLRRFEFRSIKRAGQRAWKKVERANKR